MADVVDAVKIDVTKEEAKKEEAASKDNKDSVEQKILKQIEYYFGDNNLPRDKFLKNECAQNEGWMPIEKLLTFNRVKTLVKDVADDKRVAKIADVVRESELVDVDESSTKLRRNPEVPLSDSNSENRTVYLKGFNRLETVLDDLLEFFSKFEGMEAVLMRYYKEKTLQSEATEDAENGVKKETEPTKVVWVRKFKGSIFVVFKTPEQANKLLSESIVFKGNPINLKMLHSQYRETKRAEYQARLEARKKKSGGEEANGETKVEAVVEDEEQAIRDDIVEGALVKVTNLPKDLSREDFKEKWHASTSAEDCKILFMDFNKGDTEGIVRLEKEGSAAAAIKLLENGELKISDGVLIKVTEITGDEEKAYLQKVTEKRLERKRKGPPQHGGRGRGRGRGRGGRGGRGGKRRRY